MTMKHHQAELLYYCTKAVTLARNFESAEQEVNYTQAINLAINGTSDINTKITQLKLTNHHNREKITTTADIHSNRTVSNSNNLRNLSSTTKEDNGPKSRKLIPATKILAKHSVPIFHTSKSTNYYQSPPMTQAIPHYQTSSYSQPRPRAIDYNQRWSNSNNNQMQTNDGLSRPISSPTGYPNQASYFGLIEDQSFDKSTPGEEKDVEQISQPSMQVKTSGIITKQLMDQLGHQVDYTATTQIITADGNTKIPIGEINNFLFEINGIQISTKVFVMEVTQYQALVGNDWLSKANATLD
ncbi:hypothetical protein G9A89_023628 [Geosiphon pyriformis]|nr:hypothetical protein G9A89_023628 [Geosiphon pyriformis]